MEDSDPSGPERRPDVQGWAVFDPATGRPRYWTRSRIVAVVTCWYAGLQYVGADLPPDEVEELPAGLRQRRVLGWIVVALVMLVAGVLTVGPELMPDQMLRAQAALAALLGRAP